MATTSEGLEFEQVLPRSPGRGRRITIIALGTVLAVMACGVIGVAFVQGSWWYAEGTDRALDVESRARVEALRDEVEAHGGAPEAVTRLNAALEPGAHPTDIRTYLLEAQEVLEATGDPELAEVARELRTIADRIRPSEDAVAPVPYTPPTVVWP
jgi:hypothetical protein